jgi:hypothetical protein
MLLQALVLSFEQKVRKKEGAENQPPPVGENADPIKD